MVSRLVKEMGALSQKDEDEVQQPARRKSARLSNRREEKEEHLHDSGTESDEEEMESYALHRAAKGTDPFATWQRYEQFLAGASPPTLRSAPPVARDVDTESWDSFGRESGIMTGDNDSDDGTATPTPRRRMRDPRLPESNNSNSGAEKRRYSMTQRDEDRPIAHRTRSGNADFCTTRPMKIAARRIPVRVLINQPQAVVRTKVQVDVVDSTSDIGCPPSLSHLSEGLPYPPATKRSRRISHRPYCDFDKMVQNRIDGQEEPSTSTTPTQAERAMREYSMVTRSQNNNINNHNN